MTTAPPPLSPLQLVLRGIEFSIPGKPFAKQRPRATRQGRVYTPSETVAFERVVGQIAVPLFPKPFECPLEIIILAVFEPPSSWSKKKRNALLGAPHTQRPDLDNCVKAILDGLNRIAWVDDGQIASITATKLWGERPGTNVTVKPL